MERLIVSVDVDYKKVSISYIGINNNVLLDILNFSPSFLLSRCLGGKRHSSLEEKLNQGATKFQVKVCL